MADYIINLSGNICELFIALYFFKGRYTPRCKKAIFGLLCIVFTLFQFVNTNLFLAKSPLVSFFSLIFVFSISLLYDMKWVHRLIFSVILFVIIGASEIVNSMILSSVLRMEISTIQNNPLLFACATHTRLRIYSIVIPGTVPGAGIRIISAPASQKACTSSFVSIISAPGFL